MDAPLWRHQEACLFTSTTDQRRRLTQQLLGSYTAVLGPLPRKFHNHSWRLWWQHQHTQECSFHAHFINWQHHAHDRIDLRTVWWSVCSLQASQQHSAFHQSTNSNAPVLTGNFRPCSSLWNQSRFDLFDYTQGISANSTLERIKWWRIFSARLTKYSTVPFFFWKPH